MKSRSKSIRMRKKPSKTAIHEIAHAYTAHLLGSKVEKVEIFDDDTGCLDVYHLGNPEPDPI